MESEGKRWWTGDGFSGIEFSSLVAGRRGVLGERVGEAMPELLEAMVERTGRGV